MFVERGVFDLRDGWFRDPILRAAGLALLVCCWLSLRWLLHAAGPGGRHAAASAEYAAAAVCFLCFSAGGLLTTLGTRIFDRVEVSARWAAPPRPSPGERRDLPPPASWDPGNGSVHGR